METIAFIGTALVVLGLSTAIVFAPLRQNDAQTPAQKAALFDGLEAAGRRDSAYVALRDLDADYAAGDLHAADYQELRTRYMHQAIEALIALDRYQERHRPVDEEIEAAISGERMQLLSKATATPGVAPSGKVRVRARIAVSAAPSGSSHPTGANGE